MRTMILWLALAVALAGCLGGETEGSVGTSSRPMVSDEQADETAEMFGKAETRSTGRRATIEGEGGAGNAVGGDPDSIEDPYEFSYTMGYEGCGYDVEQLFSEAGTRDPYLAADWFGETYKEGPHRAGSVAGCLDAVLGRSPRH